MAIEYLFHVGKTVTSEGRDLGNGRLGQGQTYNGRAAQIMKSEAFNLRSARAQPAIEMIAVANANVVTEKSWC